MRSGIDLIEDVPGTGPVVVRLRTYRLRLRMWLNQGEAVRWTSPWGQVDSAVLETGMEIHVPLFIKEGEKIKVHTETREFAGRA